MKPEKAVVKIGPPKRSVLKQPRFCKYIFNTKQQITDVLVPVEIFNAQFDALNDKNLFFEIYEYIEKNNEE